MEKTPRTKMDTGRFNFRLDQLSGFGATAGQRPNQSAFERLRSYYRSKGQRGGVYDPRPAPILEKTPDSLVPTVVTPPMITTLMRAAIKPYSMAVAPDSSAIKLQKCFFTPKPP